MGLGTGDWHGGDDSPAVGRAAAGVLLGVNSDGMILMGDGGPTGGMTAAVIFGGDNSEEGICFGGGC